MTKFPRSYLYGKADRVPAGHYGLTDEELDFIPSTKLRAGPSMKLRAGNYDIKYRMGYDLENEEE